jgi:glycosyltransferase involved in cell wall biosynthesis
MRRLLINDMLSALPEHRTFWNDLQDWFGMEFIGGDYGTLEGIAAKAIMAASVTDKIPLVIRNASYFPPIRSVVQAPTISLLQDIFTEGEARFMQQEVIQSSKAVVFNSAFTKSKYEPAGGAYVGNPRLEVIPLPVDFSLFEPQNAMGCQQALGLPDGCVCWVGATQGPAGEIKGFDIFLKIVRMNPDLHFVLVAKDAIPDSFPPNLRCFLRLTHEELVKVIGACRVGLCTSRMESQHLAGIEMGACGLPMVAPQVGIYWKRDDLATKTVGGPSIFGDIAATVEGYTSAIRLCLGTQFSPDKIRESWKREFDRPAIRAQWEKLINEVESAPLA